MKHILSVIFVFIMVLSINAQTNDTITVDQQTHWGPGVALYLPVSYTNFDFHLQHQEAMCVYIQTSLNNKYVKKDNATTQYIVKNNKVLEQIKILKKTYKLKQKTIKELSKNKITNANAIKNEQSTLMETLSAIYEELHDIYQHNKHILDL